MTETTDTTDTTELTKSYGRPTYSRWLRLIPALILVLVALAGCAEGEAPPAAICDTYSRSLFMAQLSLPKGSTGNDERGTRNEGWTMATSHPLPATRYPLPTNNYQLEKAMSGNVVDEFRQQEAEQLASERKYNQWSRTLLKLMIAEYEQKLLASDLPVDDEETVFWYDLER
ncbi:MAG: hypothetical protein R6X34_09120 [Chloroflexota bacterium]